MRKFEQKVWLLTGGTGSLGGRLVERIKELNPKEIRVFSRSEILQDKMREKHPDITYILGDVRDYFAVKRAVKGADIIIHAAAFKYLDLSETQPRECVLTNVNGTLNIIQAADIEKPEMVVGISTDKVSYARNVYGCTKQIMEKLLEEAGHYWVRYGNVLGTNGSIVPKWKKMADNGVDLMVTDKRMTRFFFTLDDAIDAIFQCLKEKKNIIPKMKAMRIWELAEVMAGGKVKIYEGKLRPGEKIHETLVADYEGKEITSETADKYTKKEIKQILENLNCD